MRTGNWPCVAGLFSGATPLSIWERGTIVANMRTLCVVVVLAAITPAVACGGHPPIPRRLVVEVSAQLPARMQAVYGMPLETLEAEWRIAVR